jgi:hypothetical protein
MGYMLAKKHVTGQLLSEFAVCTSSLLVMLLHAALFLNGV